MIAFFSSSDLGFESKNFFYSFCLLFKTKFGNLHNFADPDPKHKTNITLLKLSTQSLGNRDKSEFLNGLTII